MQNYRRKHRVLANAVLNSKEKSSSHFNFNAINDENPEKIQLKKRKFKGIILSKAKNEIPWVTYSVSLLNILATAKN